MRSTWFRTVVTALVVLSALAFFARTAFAQSAYGPAPVPPKPGEETIPIVLIAPYVVFGEHPDGTKWVTSITIFNRTRDETVIVDPMFWYKDGTFSYYDVTYADGPSGHAWYYLRRSILPGEVQRFSISPCLLGSRNCPKGDEKFHAGHFEFTTKATWSEYTNKYEPWVEVQVGLIAYRNGLAYSSMSRQAVNSRDLLGAGSSSIIHTLEVVSTSDFSTGVAIVLPGVSAPCYVDFELRDRLGEILETKKDIYLDRSQVFVQTIDELFPDWQHKLPIAQLRVKLREIGGNSWPCVFGVRFDLGEDIKYSNILTVQTMNP